MNIFKRQLQNKKIDRSNQELNVISVSNLIQNALNFTDQNIEELDYPITVGEYKIVGETRCFKKWVNVLEVIPIDNKMDSVGWSNEEGPRNLDFGWMYIPKGTATINCPPKYIVDIICLKIKETIKNGELT